MAEDKGVQMPDFLASLWLCQQTLAGACLYWARVAFGFGRMVVPVCLLLITAKFAVARAEYPKVLSWEPVVRAAGLPASKRSESLGSVQQGRSGTQELSVAAPGQPGDYFPIPVVGSNATWEVTFRPEDRFTPPPRELSRALVRGYEAYAAGNFDEAVDWLGAVISRESPEDYLVKVPGDIDGNVSLTWAAHALMSAIAPKQRQLFQLKHAAVAQRLLEQSLVDHDAAGLTEVSRRFLYTDAGIEATLLLGYDHFNKGRPGFAASVFRRLLTLREAKQKHDPELSLLLAVCDLLGDQPQQARQTLQGIRNQAAATELLTFGGRQVPWFDSQEDPLNWLARLIGESGYANSKSVQEWLVSGGNSRRNLASGTGFPLQSCRWELPRINDVLVEEAVLQAYKQRQERQVQVILASPPVVTGSTVVYRSFAKTIGIDLRTGRRSWFYPAVDDLSADQAALGSMVLGEDRPESPSLDSWLSRQGGADDLSSDGKRVFFVEQTNVSDSLESGVWINSRRSDLANSNRLVALDVEKQGAMHWVVGGDSGFAEPKLAGAYFLGPPLPIEGNLYSIAWLDGIVQLLEIDTATGALVWQQSLATVESSLRLDDGSQQSISPTFASGVLVCPTGLGVVVAVDLSAKNLLWGLRYASTMDLSGTATFRRSATNGGSVRWLGPAIQVIGNRVLLTPQESDFLYCVDLMTGKTEWESPDISLPSSGNKTVRRPRVPDRVGEVEVPKLEGLPKDSCQFVVGGVDDTILMVGADRIRGVSLGGGKFLWETLLPSDLRISGLGFFNQNSAFLPTTRGTVVQVACDEGAISLEVNMSTQINTMVCNDRDVVTLGIDRVAAFFQGDAAEKLVNAVEAKVGNDAAVLAALPVELLVLKGQLLVSQKRWEEAIELLEITYQRQSTDYHGQLLANAILDLLRNDGQRASNWVQKHWSLLAERDLVVLLRFQVEGAISNRDWLRATNYLAELSILDPAQQTDQEFVSDLNSRVRMSWPQWIHVQWNQITAELSLPGQREGLLACQSVLDQQSQLLLSRGDVDALSRFCINLGPDTLPLQQQWQLAELFFERREWLKCQSILLPYLQVPSKLSGDWNVESTDLRQPVDQPVGDRWIVWEAECLMAQVLWRTGFGWQAFARLEELRDWSRFGNAGQTAWQSAVSLEVALGRLDKLQEQWELEASTHSSTQPSGPWGGVKDVSHEKQIAGYACQVIGIGEGREQISLTVAGQGKLLGKQAGFGRGFWFDSVSQTQKVYSSGFDLSSSGWIAVECQQTLSNFPLKVSCRYQPNMNLLELCDGWGQRLGTVFLGELASRGFDPKLVPHSRMVGGMWIGQFGGEVVCVDLFRMRRGVADPKIWIRDIRTPPVDLLPPDSLNPLNSGYRTVQLNDRWGVSRNRYSDTRSSRSLGSVSNVLRDSFAFESDGQIVCVDSIAGQVRWIRSEAVEITNVIQSDAHYFAIYQTGIVGKFDRQSGELLEEFPFPGTYDSVWDVFGQFALMDQEDDQTKEKKLAVWDLERNHLVWEAAFDRRALATLDPINQTISTLDEAGHFVVRDLATGTIECESEVEMFKGSESLNVVERPDSWLVFLSGPESRNQRIASLDVQFSPIPSWESLSMIHLQKIDKKDFKPAWKESLAIEYFSIWADQPDFLPFLTMGRMAVPGRRMSGQGVLTQVVGVDLRDGSLLFDQRVQTSVQMVKMSADPASKQIRIDAGPLNFVMTWTDKKDAPPRPMVQLRVSEPSARMYNSK